ncbi:L-threonylcarbamoyladenylate synthase [Alphaproteobacteria bacterium]|nr:L-threonylcarbamoyladenylate synthase [Alphaproteobacteria bacterium]
MIKDDEIKKIIQIIKECSAVALKFYKQKNLEISIKDDNSPVTKADLEISKIASNKLSEIFPNYKIISEENITHLNKVDVDRYWLIDPIDGTKEFITKSGFFTINFALISYNKPVFGIICQPTTSSIWFNSNNKAYKISKTFNIKDAQELKPKVINFNKLNIICSTTNLKSDIKSWLNIIKPLKISDIGSSLKFCYLAEGKYDIYPRSIPTMEWDTAAGHSILKASGGNIFTTSGLELYYGKNNFKNNNFIAFSNYKNFPLPKYFLENIKDYKIYKKRIETASNSLKNGKLIVFPTETVFGLGAIGIDEQAVSGIYTAKNRPKNNPLIAHFSCVEQIKKYVIFNELASTLATKFWPGPLTIVLNINEKNRFSKILSRGKNTLAVRIPSHPVALDLISKCQIPILAPSANKSGGVSPTSAEHVKQDFKKLYGPTWEISDILNYEGCEVGIESTVVDCRNEFPVILREGFITLRNIEDVIDVKVRNKNYSSDLISPGMLQKHYAPKTKVLLNQKQYIPGSACLGFGKLPIEFKNCNHNFNLSLSENLFEASHLLYEGLRYLDKFELKFIQVLPIPNKGIGKALNDRLKKASFNE